jgi:hypothetical protein
MILFMLEKGESVKDLIGRNSRFYYLPEGRREGGSL